METKASVVIDNGSGKVKAGLATDDLPKVILPSVFPDKGAVTNWDTIEDFWRKIFVNDLKVDISEHPVLITETAFNLRNRQQMAEIFFEKFNVQDFYISLPAVLALYGAGRTTGLVLDAGHSLSYTLPIYEGHAVIHALGRLKIGGRDLTEFLMRIIRERGYEYSTKADHSIIQTVKENNCYVSTKFNEEFTKSLKDTSIEKTFKLPDGTEITLGNERFRCPEALFTPTLMEMEADGVHEMIHDSINKSDTSLRRDFYSSIVVSGGGSLFPGMIERLQREMDALAPSNVNVEIIDPKDRKNNAWVGGNVMSSLKSFRKMCITKKEYEESGSTIVRKCF